MHNLDNYSQEFIEFLIHCNNENTNKFEFTNGMIKLAKVLNVYDGDTITVAICIHPTNNDINMVYKFNVRMYGYDTEEIRQPLNDPNREEKKAKAIQQRDWLREQILNKLVWLECLGYDKYGRILGKVYTDENKTDCINDIIINDNLADKYLI